MIKRHPIYSIAAIALVGAVVTGLGYTVTTGNLFANLKHVPSRRISAPRLTTLVNTRIEPGKVVAEGQFSHNGGMVAFSAPRDGQSDIWVKQINNSNAIRVTNNDSSNFCPVWSPDDLTIGYVSPVDGQFGVWTVPALGGAPTLITTIEFDPKNPGQVRLRKWSTIDITKMFYETNHNLYQLDIVSKEIKQLTSFDLSKDQPVDFAVSPDEKMIAYSETKNNKPAVFVSALDGTSPSVLSDDAVYSVRPEWLSDGKRIIYSSRNDDTFQLVYTRLEDHSSEQVTFDNSDHCVTSVSRDGTKILDITRKDESHLWGVDIQSHVETIYTTEGGLQLWPVTFPNNSPNSSMVIFQATHTPDYIPTSDLVAEQLPGSGNRIRLAADAGFADVSPDGQFVAFTRLKDGVVNLWAVDSSGRMQKQLTTGGIATAGYSFVPCNKLDHWDHSWSPDGKEIVFQSVKDGLSNLSKVSLNTNNVIQITNNTDKTLYFRSPLYSPDGKKLAHITIAHLSGGKRLWSIAIQEDGRSSVLYQSERAVRLLGWSNSGDSLIFASDEKPGEHNSVPTNVGLNIVPIATGLPRLVTTINSAYLVNAQISPDRQSVVLVCRLDKKDNIWMASLTDGSGQMLTSNTDPTVYLTGPCWSANGHSIFFSKQESVNIISLIDNLF